MHSVVKLSKGLLLAACAIALLPCGATAQHYIQKNLVSDGFVPAVTPSDADLRNPWGLTRSATSPWWVSDNGRGIATIYNGSTGAKAGLVVTIPVPNGGTPPSAPTGAVFNGRPNDFLLPNPNGKAASFIFATEDGTIAAWNGGQGTTAMIVAGNPGKAVYKGITIAESEGSVFLYVANFRSGRVEVYDTSFRRVRLSEELFDFGGEDERPRGYAPFGIQAVGDNIYVTYAKQNEEKHDDVPGEGNGFVIVYSPSGKRLGRLEHGPWMNSPWGIALAPGDFGEFSHLLLVGNFGSGQIAAFNLVTGKFKGFVKTFDDPVKLTGEHILVIEGLWALGFGNGAGAGPYNTLFFTAGLNGEADGLFGTLVPIPSELTEGDEP